MSLDENGTATAGAESTDIPTFSIDMDKPCIKCGAKGSTPSGYCLSCVTKSITRFPVPSEEEFGDDSFIEREILTKLGEEIVAEYPDFREVQNAKIIFLWKRKGGKSGTNLTLGKCQKPSGLLAHFASADFIIWIAADHANELCLTEFQARALLFHELKHADYDPEKGEYIIYSHEFEGFKREVEVFGFWRPDIEEMAKAFKAQQQKLFNE